MGVGVSARIEKISVSVLAVVGKYGQCEFECEYGEKRTRVLAVALTLVLFYVGVA
jgi:hypothetical protein